MLMDTIHYSHLYCTLPIYISPPCSGYLLLSIYLVSLSTFILQKLNRSINIEDAKEEQTCIKEILVKFQPEDCWNVDESALFTFPPPDHGLAQKQMSGKRASKFCITLCFACNANGSQKKGLFFIGKSKQPCCLVEEAQLCVVFITNQIKQHGWQGSCLKREFLLVWMHPSATESCFKWIKEWGIELQPENHHIALKLDNFTSHSIQYQLKCITLVYFPHGLTSHVQPLDARIICCFKAHYWHQFCLCAIVWDDAEEANIYKLISLRQWWCRASMGGIKRGIYSERQAIIP